MTDDGIYDDPSQIPERPCPVCGTMCRPRPIELELVGRASQYVAGPSRCPNAVDARYQAAQ